MQPRMARSRKVNYPLDKVISNEVDLGPLLLVDEDDQKISTWETDIQSFVAFKDKKNKI